MKSLPIQAAFFAWIATAACGFAAEPTIASSGGNNSTNAIGPRIAFDSIVYDFGKAIAGTQVRHEFLFTNTGDATLEISGVYPGCGCTTAGAWTRQVEPGKTGVIPLQFNTEHYAGQTVTKIATVACNDKNQSAVRLEIKGTVWKPIDVSPQVAVLNIIADAPSNAPAVVRIVSSLDEPITLSELHSSNPAFAAELKTIQPNKEFQLVIRTVPPLGQGNVQGTITIKTSSTKVPTIEVTALAVVQSAIVVSPPQILVPAGPLPSAFTCVVMIRNNGAEPLTLSEPAVSADGVQIQMKEIQPGRQFMVTSTFPVGFQMESGREAGLGIKTSHPQYPVLNVPVRQTSRPVLPRPPIVPAPAPPVGRQ